MPQSKIKKLTFILNSFQEQISLELEKLLSLSSESVTQQDYSRVTKDFKELTAKYRETQQKQIFLVRFVNCIFFLNMSFLPVIH